VGRHRVVDLTNLLQDVDDADMPALAREALRSLIAELQALDVRIEAVEAVIVGEPLGTPRCPHRFSRRHRLSCETLGRAASRCPIGAETAILVS
jgi:hypothetical protein